ncbi:extracellular solute-binding protein [Paludicola sp. MB14-C6]|uniref:ABC transporter substrate-binding protein n=1 Tax=Paludihabitans sp. MB14-C6 TaxID=3070656 RepID=UPI0027DE908E|nr:extracellular solute-binding protein [Paludicola sp. MB14-C6]WMJ22736.1 extracellular solute-binding protein [Paludicola sp. MB14-C6]
MKLTKISSGMLALLIAATTAMTGCGDKQPSSSKTNSGTTEKPVIEFYHGYFQSKEEWPTAAVMRDIYDKFAKDNADKFTFKVNVVETGGEGIQTKCLQEVANGSFPDMVDLGGYNCIPAAVAAKAVLDLKPYIDKDSSFKANVGVNYEQNQINRGIYSIKEQIESIGFWYNEELFQKAQADTPDKWKTWDDFDKAVDKLKGCKEVESPFTLAQGWPTNLLLTGNLMNSAEGRKLMSSPVPDFTNNAFKDTLNFITNSALKKVNSANFTPDDDTYRQNFINGKSAMLFNGVWDASSFDAKATKFKPAIFPTSEAGKKAAIVSAGAGLTISSKLSDAQKEACVAFVKYMTSEEVAKRIFTEGLAMPSSSTFDYSKYLNDSNVGIKNLAAACQLVQSADYKVKAIGATWGGDVEAAITGKYAQLKDGSKTTDQVINELKSIVAE